MPGRPPPPMYSGIRRKVTPQQRQIVVQPRSEEELQKRAEAAQKAAAKAAQEIEKARKAAQKAAQPAKPVKKPAVKKPAAKPTAVKKSTKKATKKPAKKPAKKKAKPKIKWDPDMTKDELYQIAKKAGLNVRARDWKEEIIAELKKATK